MTTTRALSGRLAGLAAALLLSALTAALFTLAPRYRPIDDPAAASAPLLPADLAGWDRSGPPGAVVAVPGGVVLANGAAGASVAVTRMIPRPEGAARAELEAGVAASGLVPGGGAYDGARVMLVGRDDHGRYLWHRPHQLASLKADRTAGTLRRTFGLSDPVHELLLVVQLNATTGRLEVREPRVRFLAERADFRWAANGLLALWAGFFLVLGHRLIRRAPGLPARLALAGSGALMAVGLMIPGEARTVAVDALERTFGRFPIDPDDAGHMTLFALAALVTGLVRPGDRPILQLLALSALAALTEVAQLLAVERGPSLWDWAVDTTTVAVTLALLAAVRRLARARRPRLS